MTELQEVLAGVQQLWQQSEEAVVATVVRVSGSAYRRPGARMLVAPGGTRRTGMISGGCLEGDVARKAWQLTADGSATLVRYDSTADEDGTWGLGLGCNGVIEILIERVCHGDAFVSFAQECFAKGKSAIVSTVFRAEETSGIAIGSRILTSADRSFAAGALASADIYETVADEAQNCLANRTTVCTTYLLEGGRIEVLHELIEPAPQVFIFGAGWDVVPVVDAIAALGWNLTVVDRKASRAIASRFPRAEKVLVVRPDDLQRSLPLEPNCAAVIMSHDYQDDFAYLRFALEQDAWFVGLLGPARRRDRLLADLAESNGASPTLAQLARLHAPIGLDVGAETPQEIAVSVVAELIAARAGRPGAMLRHKDGPIHGESISTSKRVGRALSTQGQPA